MADNCKDMADRILGDIRNLSQTIAAIEDEANEAMKAVSEKYEAMLRPLKDNLAVQDKAIVKFMKAQKKVLFEDGEIVRLKNGALIYSKEPKVSIPKDALEKAEEVGFTEAIKIAKSLDRGVVETWPDEKLFLIGAERKSAEKYSYDIKGETKK